MRRWMSRLTSLSLVVLLLVVAAQDEEQCSCCEASSDGESFLDTEPPPSPAPRAPALPAFESCRLEARSRGECDDEACVGASGERCVASAAVRVSCAAFRLHGFFERGDRACVMAALGGLQQHTALRLVEAESALGHIASLATPSVWARARCRPCL